MMLMAATGSNGLPNTIDVSSPTLGADLQAKLNAVDPRDRIYITPKLHNVTKVRTETQYEETASGIKFKLDGVGDITTLTAELWDKDSAFQIQRELKKAGCTDMVAFDVDIAGCIWGILDDKNSSDLRGYKVAPGTVDSFGVESTDTTVQKVILSWDYDKDECMENSYAITSEELGYKASTLTPLMSAEVVATEPVDGTVNIVVRTCFGTAANRVPVVGLDSVAPPIVIGLLNVTTNTAMTAPTGFAAVANSEGEYTFDYLTAEAALNDVIQITITGATGYDVETVTFVHAF